LAERIGVFMNVSLAKKKLHAWCDLLTADHIARGRTWYTEAHAFAQEVAHETSVPIDRVVGVLAVLSVQNRWDTNKRDVEAFCQAYAAGEDLDTVPCSTYDSQRQKAIDILEAPTDADISTMIGTKYAPKTRAFYDNILNPRSSFRVTIDRWILRGLNLEYYTSGGGNRYIAMYRDLEEVFRQVALEKNLRPCELQAAVWCCIQSIAAEEHWEGSRPGTGLAKESTEEVVPF
jgi:hypothetical protein